MTNSYISEEVLDFYSIDIKDMKPMVFNCDLCNYEIIFFLNLKNNRIIEFSKTNIGGFIIHSHSFDPNRPILCSLCEVGEFIFTQVYK